LACFVAEEVAQRDSTNHPADTNETKTVNMDRALCRDMMINKVIPATRERFPGGDKNVVIQQDGTKSYIKEHDAEFLAAGATGSWNISLETQPTRFPDLNHLDLSFFCALQPAQWATGFASDVDELIAIAEAAYWDFQHRRPGHPRSRNIKVGCTDSSFQSPGTTSNHNDLN
jgi:hypothetical protein